MTGRSAARWALGGCLALSVSLAGGALAEQRVLGDEPPNANAAVVPFVEDLQDADPQIRISAALALRELGPVAWLAVPHLIQALDDSSVGVRKSAAGALGGIGPGAEAAVPALREALGDPHRFVRSWAAMAIYEIGPGARAATPDLIRLLATDSDNLRGRSWAASALPRIASPPAQAIPALIAALEDDESQEVRAVAALSIESFGEQAAAYGAVAALVDGLVDPHWKVRGNAASALPAMGPDARDALSQLVVALRDPAPYVRGCAADALGRIERAGEPAQRLAHELEALLIDDDAHVRERAKQAHARLTSAK